MREMDTRFPTTDTVFEYCVDPNQRGWLSWENKLSSSYRSFHCSQQDAILLLPVAVPLLSHLLSLVMPALLRHGCAEACVATP